MIDANCVSAERIEEMKRLSAEATPGPWNHYIEENGEVITEGYVEVAEYLPINDAQFIAKSRQFVPDIIAAYEEQAEEIAELRKALANIQSDCESAKERYVEESDIDGILETAKEALSWRNTTRK